MLLLEFVSPLAELDIDTPTPTILVAAARDGTVVVFEPDGFPAYQLFKTDDGGSPVLDPAPPSLTCMAYTHDRTMFATGTKAGGLRLSPGLPVRATWFLYPPPHYSTLPPPSPSLFLSLPLNGVLFLLLRTLPLSFCCPLSISIIGNPSSINAVRIVLRKKTQFRAQLPTRAC